MTRWSARTHPVPFADVVPESPYPVGVPRPERIDATPLSALAGTLVGDDRSVSGITSGTAFVRPGDLFAAVPGSKTHGAAYAAAAVDAGAVAVLTDAAGRDLVPAGVPVLLVEDVRTELGPVSAQIYGNPSSKLNVLGVTGTSGKTTTTFLMEAGLRAAGRVPGLIGTVGIHIGDAELKTAFTTPEAPEVQALLAVMSEAGVTDVAMEVSSHALSLGRVGGTAFAAAGFTNLSEDHLDFHPTMQDYYEAKRLLFTQYSRAGTWVVVAGDDWAARLVRDIGAGVTTVSRGANHDWSVSGGIRRELDGSSRFVIRRDLGPFASADPIEAGCAIPGEYNVDNVLLALAMLDKVGVGPSDAVVDAIARATVPGRMEPVSVGQPFLAVVDYSHKPAAVDGALKALRPLTLGRLIIVLGCGGDRDRGKRPHMGEIAARGADLLIVTDDNPRTEVAADIRQAMLAGALSVPADERGEVIEVGDRVEAIVAAVADARDGDTVLVAGKGHELGQEIAGVVYPFDDRVVLRNALNAVRS